MKTEKQQNIINSYSTILLGEKFACGLIINGVARTIGMRQLKFTKGLIESIADAHENGEEVRCYSESQWFDDFINTPLPSDITPDNVRQYFAFIRSNSIPH